MFQTVGHQANIHMYAEDEVKDLLELLSLMQSVPEQFYQITNELV